MWDHLVAACGLLSCGMHAASSSPTRDRTQDPCSGSTESYPLDHQGGPLSSFIISVSEIPQLENVAFRKIILPIKFNPLISRAFLLFILGGTLLKCAVLSPALLNRIYQLFRLYRLEDHCVPQVLGDHLSSRAVAPRGALEFT